VENFSADNSQDMALSFRPSKGVLFLEHSLMESKHQERILEREHHQQLSEDQEKVEVFEPVLIELHPLVPEVGNGLRLKTKVNVQNMSTVTYVF
jgi:hypothetical protein